MPFSGPQFDEAFRVLVETVQPHTVFEVGPGNGKYARIIRGMVDSPHPVQIHAVELEPSYIDRFHLHDFYDQINIGRGSMVMQQENAADLAWDLVVLGDVLEHMPKSEGVDLLHYFVYRAKWLWLRWPVRYVQGAWEGFESEAHVSVWGKLDLELLRADYVTLEKGSPEAFIVRGYQLGNTNYWGEVIEKMGAFHGVINLEAHHD